MVPPVTAGRVDVVFAEDFAGVEMDDGDGVFVGDGEDSFRGVRSPHSEVVHPSGTSDAHVSVSVDVVVAQPVAVG